MNNLECKMNNYFQSPPSIHYKLSTKKDVSP